MKCLCRRLLEDLLEALLFYLVLLKNLCIQFKTSQCCGDKAARMCMTLLMVKALWKDRIHSSRTELKASPRSIWEKTSPSNSKTFNTLMQESTCAHEGIKRPDCWTFAYRKKSNTNPQWRNKTKTRDDCNVHFHWLTIPQHLSTEFFVITNFPVPTTRRHLHRFLEMSKYHL